MKNKHGNPEFRLRSGTMVAAILSLTLLLGTPTIATASRVGLQEPFSVTSGSASVQSRWRWPTQIPVAVNRAFDPPALPWLSGHRGVDLGATVGSTIVAPADGTVVFSGTVVSRQTVSVMHEGGLRSTYEPVLPLVKTGDTVQAGQPIATVEPGHSPGSLHWGARFGKDEYVNPLRMLVGPSVLKPW